MNQVSDMGEIVISNYHSLVNLYVWEKIHT